MWIGLVTGYGLARRSHRVVETRHLVVGADYQRGSGLQVVGTPLGQPLPVGIAALGEVGPVGADRVGEGLLLRSDIADDGSRGRQAVKAVRNLRRVRRM